MHLWLQVFFFMFHLFECLCVGFALAFVFHWFGFIGSGLCSLSMSISPFPDSFWGSRSQCRSSLACVALAVLLWLPFFSDVNFSILSVSGYRSVILADFHEFTMSRMQCGCLWHSHFGWHCTQNCMRSYGGAWKIWFISSLISCWVAYVSASGTCVTRHTVDLPMCIALSLFDHDAMIPCEKTVSKIQGFVFVAFRKSALAMSGEIDGGADFV